MTWNYRLVKYFKKGPDGESYYGVHEVFYDDSGKPEGMTEKPITFHGESPEEVIEALEMALKDAKNRPVYEEPEE